MHVQRRGGGNYSIKGDVGGARVECCCAYVGAGADRGELLLRHARRAHGCAHYTFHHVATEKRKWDV